jgi:hypothetical protein
MNKSQSLAQVAIGVLAVLLVTTTVADRKTPWQARSQNASS